MGEACAGVNTWMRGQEMDVGSIHGYGGDTRMRWQDMDATGLAHAGFKLECDVFIVTCKSALREVNLESDSPADWAVCKHSRYDQ